MIAHLGSILRSILRVASTIAGLLQIINPSLAQDLSRVANDAQASVVQILVTGTDAALHENKNPGSAFIVYSDDELKRTFLFTAAHVIGQDKEWLLDDTGRVKQRKIQIRRQISNNSMTVVTEDAGVIASDVDTDVAVLWIPEQPIVPLQIIPSNHLMPNDPVAMAGFPGDQYVASIARIRVLNFSEFKVEIDKLADGGQSGGPVIDWDGHVIAIVSQNDDRQRPKYHHATMIWKAVQMLNAYLEKSGRPLLAIQPTSIGVPKITVISRSGTAKVVINTKGNGKGGVATDRSASSSLGSEQVATLREDGSEVSECEGTSGRIQSVAQATASIDTFESTGLKAYLSLEAQGGRYRTTTACIAQRLVGFADHDTAASATAEIVGKLLFRVSTQPIIIRLVWQNMPSGSRVTLVAPNDEVRAEVTSVGDGSRDEKIDMLGLWQVNMLVVGNVKSSDASDHRQLSGQPFLVLDAH